MMTVLIPGPQRERNSHGEDEAGESLEDVHQTHDEFVGELTDVRGNCTDECADEERNYDGLKCNPEIETGAIDYAREDVFSEVVGAERM